MLYRFCKQISYAFQQCKKFWTSVKISQSYRECSKVGT